MRKSTDRVQNQSNGRILEIDKSLQGESKNQSSRLGKHTTEDNVIYCRAIITSFFFHQTLSSVLLPWLGLLALLAPPLSMLNRRNIFVITVPDFGGTDLSCRKKFVKNPGQS